MKKYILTVLIMMGGAALLAQTKIKVVCIGNSITQGATSTLNYPVILNGMLGTKYQVYNMGKSGTTLRFSSSAAWIKETALKDSIRKIIPDIVTIKLGTNDAGGGTGIGAEYKADYLKLIDSVKKWSSPTVKIYLCYPIPIFNSPTSDMVIDSVIIPAIKEISIQKSLPVIDLNKPFDGHADYVVDGIHPSSTGFQLIAKTIFDSIKTKVTKITLSVDNGGSPVITTNGGKIQMKAVVEPANATISAITWSVQNIDGTAIINSLGGLTGKTNGTVKAIATSVDDPKIKGELLVTISNQSALSFVEEQDIQVFPNPTNDYLELSGLQSKSKINIYNASGILQWSGISSGSSININTSGWESGPYYISIPEKKTIKVIKE